MMVLTSSCSGASCLYLATFSFKSSTPDPVWPVVSATRTWKAVAGKAFGGFNASTLRVRISCLFFFSAAAAVCSSVRGFFLRVVLFGFAFDFAAFFTFFAFFAFFLGAVFALVDFVPAGFLFADVAVFVVVSVVLGFRVLVDVVRPVCALGRETGLVAYSRQLIRLNGRNEEG